MYVSDTTNQIVSMQAQKLRSSLTIAVARSSVEMEREVVTLLTESIQPLVASTDGSSITLDILV